MEPTRQSPLFANGHRTIGLCIDGLSAPYQVGIWSGMVAAAQTRRLNLVAFVGGALLHSPQSPWEQQRNTVYELARGLTLDGLVLVGSMGNFIAPEQYRAFLNGFCHLPMVTVAGTRDPMQVSVSVDNATGMAELVGHCVNVHRHRRFAFVGGPDCSPEARVRAQAFTGVLVKHGIDFSSEHYYAGDFTRQCGQAAAGKIIEQGVPYDVVVCANDETALGLLAAFKSAGIRVPEDVAVVGFDDIEESRYLTTPLTTVGQPMADLAVQALNLLDGLLRSENVPKDVQLPAHLIVRQTCGCSPHLPRRVHDRTSVIDKPSKTIDQRVKACVAGVCKSGIVLSETEHTRLSELVLALYREVAGAPGKRFYKTVEAVGRETVEAGGDSALWTRVLWQIRESAVKTFGVQYAAAVDPLLLDALILNAELAHRQDGSRNTMIAQESRDLRTIGDALQNALDLDQVLDVICSAMAGLFIRSCYVSLIKPGIDRANQSRLVLDYRNGIRNASQTEGTSFLSSLLVPEAVTALPVPCIGIVEPLFFHNEQYGFAFFETTECGGTEVMQQHISGALHSSLMVQKIQEQSAALSQANVELTALREKEKAYLEAVNADLELGSRIQASFLPSVFPQPPGWEIAGLFVPARVVSGDFYDAITLNDHTLVLVIADISGKGVGAALFMSVIRTLVRSFAERFAAEGRNALSAIAEANRYVIQHHSRRDGGWMYATLFAGLLDTATGVLTYVNAGHNAPLLIGADGAIVSLKPTGPAIGLHEDIIFKTAAHNLMPGDLLFAYTDGVTDARNKEGAIFSSGGLHAVLADCKGSASETIKTVSAAVAAYSDRAEQFDDMTIVAVRRN